MSCFRPLRGRLWGIFDTPLQPGTCDPLKYRCDSSTGYVWPFKKLSCFRSLRGRLWGVCDTPLQPDTCDASKYRCNAPIGYVQFFEIPMRSPDWVRAALQKTVLFSSPFGAVGWAYAIRPYDWIRVTLRNTDTISRLEGRGRLGGGAVGATACGGDGRE